MPSSADTIGRFLEMIRQEATTTWGERLRPASRFEASHHLASSNLQRTARNRPGQGHLARGQTSANRPGRWTPIRTPLTRLPASYRPSPTTGARRAQPPSQEGSSAPTPGTRRGCGVGARRPLNSALQWGAAGANPSGSRMGLSDAFRMGFGWVGRLLKTAALHGKQRSSEDTAWAMSEENLEIVRRSVAAFNRGDLDAWIECWADDIDYRAVEGAPDDHGPILGKDALRDYAQDWRNTFDDFRQEPVEQIKEMTRSSRSSGSADAPSSAASRRI